MEVLTLENTYNICIKSNDSSFFVHQAAFFRLIDLKSFKFIVVIFYFMYLLCKANEGQDCLLSQSLPLGSITYQGTRRQRFLNFAGSIFMKMFLLFVFFKQSVAWMMLCLLYVLAL
jgi:hypothetical protein